MIGAALATVARLVRHLRGPGPSGYCHLCGYPTVRAVRGVSVHEHCEAEHDAGREACRWYAFPSSECD